MEIRFRLSAERLGCAIRKGTFFQRSVLLLRKIKEGKSKSNKTSFEPTERVLLRFLQQPRALEKCFK